MVAPPRPHKLFVMKPEGLAKIRTRIEVSQVNKDIQRPVRDLGVCAAMHYVGPKGGYCPLCDESRGVESRLRHVILGEEFAAFDFDYLGMSGLPGKAPRWRFLWAQQQLLRPASEDSKLVMST